MEETAKNVAGQLGAILDWAKKVMDRAGVPDFCPELRDEICRAAGFFGAQCAKDQPQQDADPAQLPSALPDALRVVRMAGQLPYYCTRLLGCWFAVTRKAAVTPAQVAEACGNPLDVQVLRQTADACDTVLGRGTLLEDPRRVALLKKAYEAGYHYEKVYRGCAQCTLAALFDVVGNKDPHLFRITNTFASGMGLFGDGPCGGYSGGLLFLGNYAGRRLEYFDGDREEKDRCMKLCDLLHTKFLRTYGTIVCHGIHRDIFGREFNLRVPEEKVAFEEAGAHKTDKCPAAVGTAAMWTVEILLDEGLLKL